MVVVEGVVVNAIVRARIYVNSISCVVVDRIVCNSISIRVPKVNAKTTIVVDYVVCYCVVRSFKINAKPLLL